MLGVIPCFVDLGIGKSIVCGQVDDLNVGSDELRRHRERCRMGNGKKRDVRLLGDELRVMRLEAQVADTGKRRIQVGDALALVARRGDARHLEAGMSQQNAYRLDPGVSRRSYDCCSLHLLPIFACVIILRRYCAPLLR